MDLQSIKFFYKVAELEHMSNAADELNISQSALSGHIHRLEDELGLELFDRVGKRIKLNEYGKLFLKDTQPMIGIWDNTVSDLKKLEDSINSTVRISAPPLSAFSGLFEKIRSACPEVILENVNLSFSASCSALSAGKLDLLLCDRDISFPDLENCVLKTDAVVAVMRKDNHLAQNDDLEITDLMEEAFVSYPTDSIAVGQYFPHNLGSNLTPNIVYISISTKDLLDAVRKNNLIAILRQSSIVDKEMKDLKAVRLPYTEVFRVNWKRGIRHSRSFNLVKQSIIDYFRERY